MSNHLGSLIKTDTICFYCLSFPLSPRTLSILVYFLSLPILLSYVYLVYSRPLSSCTLSLLVYSLSLSLSLSLPILLSYMYLVHSCPLYLPVISFSAPLSLHILPLHLFFLSCSQAKNLSFPQFPNFIPISKNVFLEKILKNSHCRSLTQSSRYAQSIHYKDT